MVVMRNNAPNSDDDDPKTGSGSGWRTWGNPVEYQPSQASQVLERAPGEGSSFYWAINPYLGCEFGCIYDTLAPELAESAGWGEFEHRIGVKVKGVRTLSEHLRGMAERQDKSLQGHPVVFGTLSDPWQPVEREQKLTRSLLERLAFLPGLDIRALTRSSLVGRDLDLWGTLARTSRVQVAISISAHDRRLAHLLEPKAPSPDRRFMAVELLAKQGVNAGVCVGPLLKGVNDGDEELGALFQRASEVGAKFVCASALKLSEPNREALLGYLGQLYADKLGTYRRTYARSHLFDDKGWSSALDRMGELAQKHGLSFQPELAGEDPMTEKVGANPKQLKLF